MGIPHILAIPYPVQGHVNPLMQLCHILVKHGCKVTFLNIVFNQKRATTTTTTTNNNLNIRYVCLPDGLESEDDTSDERQREFLSIKSTMPNLLPKLIEDINALDFDNKITCLVVTGNMGWALEVGHNLGTKGAFLWTASAISMAFCFSIPKLIDDGIIHPSDGLPIKKQEIQLSPQMPTLDAQDLPWLTIGNIFFTNLVQNIQTIMKLGQWWLCNTAYDLEPGAFSFSQRLLPIGPLMDNNNNNKINSSFWQDDTTCLDWLDQQQPQSVVYVAFGSMVVLEQNQFKELALGLDMLKRPFLWVVRNGNNEKNNYSYPSEFHGSKGKIVWWAPQKKVLNHPSIACFISHCGWNSTMECVCSGVPFLCWPIFADQFINRAYICGVWKVGLRLEKDENGLISREEIKKKVEQVFGDCEMKERSMKLKELTMSSIVEGGQSPKNIEKFIDWAKY